MSNVFFSFSYNVSCKEARVKEEAKRIENKAALRLVVLLHFKPQIVKILSKTRRLKKEKRRLQFIQNACSKVHKDELK